MKLIDDLKEEHQRIDRTAGALRTYVNRLTEGIPPSGDGRRFLEFFDLYAGKFHHEREEQILFPTIWNDLSIPPDSPPVAVMVDTHHELGALLECIKPLLRANSLSRSKLEQLQRLSVRYSRLLWSHIDAENSVLFPELEVRLRRAGIHELPVRPTTVKQAELAAEADTLCARYPPAHDSETIRGDGCAMCPAYMGICRGIEREWWNEWEWEELEDHVAAS